MAGFICTAPKSAFATSTVLPSVGLPPMTMRPPAGEVSLRRTASMSRRSRLGMMAAGSTRLRSPGIRSGF